jgi:iron complex transport system substrate-binding protein
MKKRDLIFTGILCLFLLAEADSFPVHAYTRTVTALDGTKVELPSYPKRIACFYHPAYDKIIMLSNGSRIAMLPGEASPWAVKFFPELEGIPKGTSGSAPDLERLLKLNVDLVIYPKGRVNVAKIEGAGIPTVCPFDNDFVPKSIDEYMAELKRQVLFFGEVLGKGSGERAERYCRYLDEITSKILTITSKIPENRKPGVYYGKVMDVFSTQGNNTAMRWCTELAGGVYLPKGLQKYYTEVNMEQIIAWDPDIILFGMYGSIDSEKTSQKLKTLRAYNSGKVYNIPAGIFYWDMTSCETALLPLYLGKKFHPELFKDWDLIKEMKNFYSEIYRVTITDADAERILNPMPPL